VGRADHPTAARAAWPALEPRARRRRRARRVAPILDGDQHGVLIAAAWRHDVGYAAELDRTAFHPLDGARWLRAQGLERPACLVAHHSGARYEADERGLHEDLAEFPEENSLVAKSLTYGDLTTGPDGKPVDPQARVEDVIEQIRRGATGARDAQSEAGAALDRARSGGDARQDVCRR